MKTNRRLKILAFFLFALSMAAYSQRIAVKGDVLSGLLTSPNLGVEVALPPRFSAELSMHYNGFSLRGDKRWKHWFVQPEFRYWLCQPLGGHFLGVHAIYGWYNVGGVKLPFGLLPQIEHERYEGSLTGAGLSYGYHFILSPRWGVETSIGVGMVHTRYERFRCFHCGEQTGNGSKNYVGPTKVAVSLIYLIK